ncbi:3-isopropylmalate dehydratase large subunit [Herminiimonas contaminans]|uniref:3-isopropylmalate dehydratase large subunit n=1 Tax=Herminiimonas contaminans TaxID=1111140 RepID=A0ABS0ETY9_9BURK|nr:3-isopropylmalate dehydratase large subunit [Herminiimonas contaminans]MBF8178219.1 3-isopropylmalate dehydratase large subunit [Herminiimonas contaminans]
MTNNLFQKLWSSHIVREEADGTALLYIDRHFVNEVTSPQAFEAVKKKGGKIWRIASIVATSDHNVPTKGRNTLIRDDLARLQIQTLEKNCEDNGIFAYPMNDIRQGILHVVGPEQGQTLPGMSIVCGDSHTSTHGAFATLAFGIGTSEIEHVLTTQCLVFAKPKTMLISIEGNLQRGVSAKDLILFILRKIGSAGAAGYAIEFAGEVIARMSMEARMTICNMAIEAGARIGLIGVDDTTVDYLRGRPFSPKGKEWDNAITYWKTLFTDPGSCFDKKIIINANLVAPQISWGTSPDMVIDVNESIPDPLLQDDRVRRESITRALDYMQLKSGQKLTEVYLDKIFIGSCTNSRIEDLRAAAAIIKGQKIAQNIKLALVVPGSGLVKAQAEAEGLHQVFIDAGFEWREPGCSMCLGMNDDRLSAGERCASTSNRNFEGRQGPRGRSHLVSPQMAAAAAIKGHFTDVRLLFV